MTAQEFFKNDLFAENAGVVLLEVRKGYSKAKLEMYCFGKAGIIGVFLSYCLPHWEQRYIFRYTQPLEKWFLMQLFTILYFLCWLSQLLFYWSAWQLPS